MKNKILITILGIIFISSFLACELMPSKDSPSVSANTASFEVMNVTNVFDAEDSSDGNEVGDKAKDFEYIDKNGITKNLKDFRGQKVVLIDMWGIFCPDCRASLPTLNQLHNNYSNDGLLAIAMNVVSDPLQSILKHVSEDNNYYFANAYNADDYILMLPGETTATIPLYILIDKDGTIRHIGHSLPTTQTIVDILNE